MRQGGRPLTYEELRPWLSDQNLTKSNKGLFSSALQGIDAENTAPYFDDALESLVQQYSWQAESKDIDHEYNRADLRDEAIRRALSAVLVCLGYMPYEHLWLPQLEFSETQINAESQRRAQVAAFTERTRKH